MGRWDSFKCKDAGRKPSWILGQKKHRMGLSENGLREVVRSKKRIERVAALSQACLYSIGFAWVRFRLFIDGVQKHGVGCEIG